MNNFFAELKRRNVYKVAVAYAVVGWLLVQVTTQRENIPLYPLALTYLAYGDNEKALQFLQKCYEERGIQLQGNSGSLRIDKRLDPLRNDPRFQELVAKFMGQTK